MRVLVCGMQGHVAHADTHATHMHMRWTRVNGTCAAEGAVRKIFRTAPSAAHVPLTRVHRMCMCVACVSACATCPCMPHTSTRTRTLAPAPAPQFQLERADASVPLAMAATAAANAQAVPAVPVAPQEIN